jgi:hypothetical protein
MIEELRNSNYAETTLVVVSNTLRTKTSLIKKIRNNVSYLLYGLYRAADKRLFSVMPDALALKQISGLLGDVPIVRVYSDQDDGVAYFSPEDVEKITCHGLDVFIYIGERTLEGSILRSAKYGVWTLHVGNNRMHSGGLQGIWEVLLGWKEISSSVDLLIDGLNESLVLYQSYSQTDDISVHRNLNRIYWKSVSFIPRMLRRLAEDGEIEFFMSAVECDQNARSDYNWPDRSPTNLIISWLLFKIIVKKIVRKLWKLLRREQWILYYSYEDRQALSFDLATYNSIIPPKDRFWADPHVIKAGKEHYIFVEEVFYGQEKGHISVIVIDSCGRPAQPEIVLTRPYHLSYPFIFEYQGAYYMIPETFENNAIELYKCVTFPNEWQFAMTLMENVKAVDSTLFYCNEKWWLFTHILQHEGAYDGELHLFWSDVFPTMNWHPHHRNPIVSDVKKDRPAGPVFFCNGKYYRPAQNSSLRYGHSMTLNEIEIINERDYKEKAVCVIEPNWTPSVIATHTISNCKGLTVVDALITRMK